MCPTEGWGVDCSTLGPREKDCCSPTPDFMVCHLAHSESFGTLTCLANFIVLSLWVLLGGMWTGGLIQFLFCISGEKVVNLDIYTLIKKKS